MKHKSIREALELVASRPAPTTDPIETPVYELVSQTLFDIANNPDKKVRGSMARATRARKIIFDRLVGRRRTGTHPAQLKGEEIEFRDLTVVAIEGGKSE